MLKRWTHLFDPYTEHLRFRNLWVILPSYPLKMWNKEALTAIGNEIGQFMFMEEGFLKGIDI